LIPNSTGIFTGDTGALAAAPTSAFNGSSNYQAARRPDFRPRALAGAAGL